MENNRITNTFELSKDNKRYHTYNYYLREKFGKKVCKVPINLGLSCPNRDGTKGVGGCTYCSAELSGEFAGNPQESIKAQYEAVRKSMRTKWNDAVCIPYFQAGTNTYAKTDFLKSVFDEAIGFEDAVGLSIATRADCITEEIADMLSDLSKKTYLVVELGLQTVHDKTAERINRCHNYEDFLRGYKLLDDRGINICVHLINGLPDETREMMVTSARKVAQLKPHAVKLHLLHIITGTKMYDEFVEGLVIPMTLEDYVEVVCDQLEVLPRETVIERVTGDGAKETLVAPLWSLKKFCVMNEIDKEMGRRNSYQGFSCTE